MKLGEILRIFRIISNKKVKDVAKTVKFRSSFITDIERHRKYPNYDTIKRLAECYEVTVEQVLLIHEESVKNEWDYQKTLHESLLQWFETNNPEYLKTIAN